LRYDTAKVKRSVLSGSAALLPGSLLDLAFPLDLGDTLYMIARHRETA
jgi:hypothetical protein